MTGVVTQAGTRCSALAPWGGGALPAVGSSLGASDAPSTPRAVGDFGKDAPGRTLWLSAGTGWSGGHSGYTDTLLRQVVGSDNALEEPGERRRRGGSDAGKQARGCGGLASAATAPGRRALIAGGTLQARSSTDVFPLASGRERSSEVLVWAQKPRNCFLLRWCDQWLLGVGLGRWLWPGGREVAKARPWEGAVLGPPSGVLPACQALSYS